MNIKPCTNLSNLKLLPDILKEGKYVANSSHQCCPLNKIFTAIFRGQEEAVFAVTSCCGIAFPHSTPFLNCRLMQPSPFFQEVNMCIISSILHSTCKI